MGALSQPLARFRALFGGQHAGDFSLKRDLTRHLIALRLYQLLSQGLDLLVVWAIRQKLGFELAMQGHDRRRPLAGGAVLLNNRLDLLALVIGEVRKSRQSSKPWTTKPGPARSPPARPSTLGTSYRESSHGHEHRNNATEYRLLHVYLPCLNRPALCGVAMAEL
jgi:hypothetical protein